MATMWAALAAAFTDYDRHIKLICHMADSNIVETSKSCPMDPGRCIGSSCGHSERVSTSNWHEGRVV